MEENRESDTLKLKITKNPKSKIMVGWEISLWLTEGLW